MSAPIVSLLAFYVAFLTLLQLLPTIIVWRHSDKFSWRAHLLADTVRHVLTLYVCIVLFNNPERILQ